MFLKQREQEPDPSGTFIESGWVSQAEKLRMGGLLREEPRKCTASGNGRVEGL